MAVFAQMCKDTAKLFGCRGTVETDRQRSEQEDRKELVQKALLEQILVDIGMIAVAEQSLEETHDVVNVVQKWDFSFVGSSGKDSS
jgi:hypothetical protein